MFLLALVYYGTRFCWMHHHGGVGISHLIAEGGAVGETAHRTWGLRA
jgi:hypothetical protein